MDVQNTKRGFKVIAINLEGMCVSATTHALETEYPINEWVTHNENMQGPYAVFKEEHQDDALAFTTSCRWRTGRLYAVPCEYVPSEAKYLWRIKCVDKLKVTNCPEGTVFADAVKILEKPKPEFLFKKMSFLTKVLLRR
jgi:hypothetical protein